MIPSKPRTRLVHLIIYLRRGDQQRIAYHCRCKPSTVSSVLNGRQNQDSDIARNIIRLAEYKVDQYRKLLRGR